MAFRLSYTGEARETVADVTNAIAAFYVAERPHAVRGSDANRGVLKGQLIEAKKQLEHPKRTARLHLAACRRAPQQTGVNLATLTASTISCV